MEQKLSDLQFKRLTAQIVECERILAGSASRSELINLEDEVGRTWRFAMPGMLQAARDKQPVEAWVDAFESLRGILGQVINRYSRL
jgi:hypothetical protein